MRRETFGSIINLALTPVLASALRLTGLFVVIAALAWPLPSSAQLADTPADTPADTSADSPEGMPADPPADAPASAPGDTYVVTGVSVEQSAGSINDARSAAFDEGQRRAFAELLNRLSVPESRINPQTVGLDTISNLVAATRVEDESSSGGVYRASLAIEFRPDAVRDMLRGREATFTEVRTERTVILPVYLASGGPRLWEGDNPWHEAWRRLDPRADNLPIIVPPGDIDDVSSISADRAMRGDTDGIRSMAQRYEAGGAIVAIAEPGSQGLTVVLNRTVQGRNQSEVIRVSGDATDTAIFEEAALRAGEFIRDNWEIETEIQSGPENTLFVRVPLDSASDWFDIQQRLERMSNIGEARVVRMAPTEIILEMTYFGDESQLADAVERERLRLDFSGGQAGDGRGPDDVAILRRGG